MVPIDDQSLLYLKDDKLERGDYPKQISRILLLEKDAPSLVVGIEGLWGSGKTTILNFIKEELYKCEKKPLVIDFNPWLISSLDSLVEGFFVQLAAGIGKKDRKKESSNAATKVLQFGRFLAPIKLIPGVEPWGTLVETILSTVGGSAEAVSKFRDLDIVERKEDLNKALQKINCPIIIVIDDIDRLPPAQVRTMFQMIKATADFPGVSYLVAYDIDHVAKSLSYNGDCDGKLFCEKIVQCSYPVPRLSYFHKYQIITNEVKKSFQLSNDENILFSYILRETEIVNVLSSIRDIKRVLNRLLTSAFCLKGEVCFPDLFVLETLAQKYPDVYKHILLNSNKYVSLESPNIESEITSTVAFDVKRMLENEGNDDKKWIKTLIDPYEEIIKKKIMSLLILLFPKLRSDKIISSSEPKCLNRISDYDCFLKALHCGVMPFTFSSVEATKFCKKEISRQSVLKDYFQNDSFLIWTLKLKQYIINSNIIVEDPNDFCITFCDFIIEPENHIRSLIAVVCDLFTIAIKNDTDRQIQLSCIDFLVKKSDCLVVGAYILDYYAIKLQIVNNDNYDIARAVNDNQCLLSLDEFIIYKNIWLNTVRSVAKCNELFSQIKPKRILFRWAQYNDNNYEEMRLYLLKNTENADSLRKFIDLFNADDPFGSDIDAFKSLVGENTQEFSNRIRKKIPKDQNAMKLVELLTASSQTVGRVKDNDVNSDNKKNHEAIKSDTKDDGE